MSSIKTINYNNPLLFDFDSSIVEMVNDARIKKLPLQAGEISVFSGYEHVDADRFSISGVATLGGLATYNSIDKRYELSGSSSLSFDVGDFLTGNIFCASFKIKFGYTGWPATNIDILSTGDSLVASGNGSGFWVYHANNGNIYYRLVDSGNTTNQTKAMGIFNAVAGQEYDFEINYNMTTGIHSLFIDGVLVGATTPTILPVTERDFLRIGTSLTGTSNTDYSIKDIIFYDSIQHLTDFSIDIPRNLPLYFDVGYISSLETTSMDGFYSLASDITFFNGSEIRYAAYIDDVLKYFNGVALVNSDGSLVQTNTLDEIEAGASLINDLLINGAELRLYVAITSGATQKSSPILLSSTLEYEFFSLLVPNGVCQVWGYVLDGANPVSGAIITFKTERPYFIDGNLVSIDEKIISRTNGYYEANLIESLSVGVDVSVRVSFVDSQNSTKRRDFKIRVPALPDARIDTLLIQ